MIIYIFLLLNASPFDREQCDLFSANAVSQSWRADRNDWREGEKRWGQNTNENQNDKDEKNTTSTTMFAKEERNHLRDTQRAELTFPILLSNRIRLWNGWRGSWNCCCCWSLQPSELPRWQMFKYLRRTSDEVVLIDENCSIKDEKNEDVEQEERWKV